MAEEPTGLARLKLRSRLWFDDEVITDRSPARPAGYVMLADPGACLG